MHEDDNGIPYIAIRMTKKPIIEVTISFVLMQNLSYLRKNSTPSDRK
jgi:hypothetical protein